MRSSTVWFDDLGDLISIDLDLTRYPYRLVERYGSRVVVVTRFWRERSATTAFQAAMLNAEALVDALSHQPQTVIRPLL